MTRERAEGPSLTPHIDQVKAAQKALDRLRQRLEAMTSEGEHLVQKVRAWRSDKHAAEVGLDRLQEHYDEAVEMLAQIKPSLDLALDYAASLDGLDGAPPSPDSQSAAG